MKKGWRWNSGRGLALGGGAGMLLLAAAAAGEVKSFNIAPQTASSSIPEFARQAGRQIVAPGELLRSLRTPELRGQMEIGAALAALLQGTGLSVISDDGAIIVLAAAPQASAAAKTVLPPEPEYVVVDGYRASLTQSLNAKRISVTFSDAVFAEDTGKFADSNVAEAFNRIPGITISREIDGSGVNVSIRGLGPNFTKVLLNGAQITIASTGPTNAQNANREVDLNMFPVELFTKLTVDKSPRADQLEGGSAGAINMRSMRAFDNPGLHLAYSLKGAMSSNQNALGPQGALIVSDTAGPFGALVGITGAETRFFTQGFETVGWTTPNLTTSGSVVQCAPVSSCNMIGGGNWSIPTTVPNGVTTGGLQPGHAIDAAYLMSLNPGVSLSQLNTMLLPRLGRPFTEKGVRARHSGVASFEYRPSENFHAYVDFIGGRSTNNFDRSDISWIVRNGATIPLNVQVSANGVVTSGTFANAQWFLEARPYKEAGDFFSINPGVEWQASDLLKISLQANASRSHFLRDNPTIGLTTASSSGLPQGVTGAAVPAGGVYVTYASNGITFPSITTNVDLNDPASYQWSGGRVNVSTEKRYSYSNGIHLDLTYGGNAFNVKAGVALDTSYRNIEGFDNSQSWQNAVCGDRPNIYLSGPNSQPPCEGLNIAGNAATVRAAAPYSGYPSYPGLGTGTSQGYPALQYQGSLIPQSNLASYLREGPAGFVTVDYAKFLADAHYANFDYPNSYAIPGTNLGVHSGIVDEKTLGLYTEANGEFGIAGHPLRFNAGLRWFLTLQTIDAPYYRPNSNSNSGLSDGGYYFSAMAHATPKRHYNAYLPSLNLVYELAEDVQIRAAVSRSMTRPNPSALLPDISFNDPSASYASLGNTDLRPYFSNNIDLGLEIYGAGESHFSTSFFHKTISGFTTMTTVTMPFSYLAPYGYTYGMLSATQQAAITARGGPSVAQIQVTQVVNASGSLVVHGGEFNFTQPLDFLLAPYGLAGFGIGANLTVVGQRGQGGAPAIAVGVSPYTYNLTLYYERKGVTLRAAYVFNDEQTLTDTNQNGICLPTVASQTCPGGARLYSNAYAQLDLSAGLKLAELFGPLPSDPQITFDVQNLTQSKLRSFFQYREAAYAYYRPGMTYVFGLRGAF